MHGYLSLEKKGFAFYYMDITKKKGVFIIKEIYSKTIQFQFQIFIISNYAWYNKEILKGQPAIAW